MNQAEFKQAGGHRAASRSTQHSKAQETKADPCLLTRYMARMRSLSHTMRSSCSRTRNDTKNCGWSPSVAFAFVVAAVVIVVVVMVLLLLLLLLLLLREEKNI